MLPNFLFFLYVCHQMSPVSGERLVMLIWHSACTGYPWIRVLHRCNYSNLHPQSPVLDQTHYHHSAAEQAMGQMVQLHWTHCSRGVHVGPNCVTEPAFMLFSSIELLVSWLQQRRVPTAAQRFCLMKQIAAARGNCDMFVLLLIHPFKTPLWLPVSWQSVCSLTAYLFFSTLENGRLKCCKSRGDLPSCCLSRSIFASFAITWY